MKETTDIEAGGIIILLIFSLLFIGCLDPVNPYDTFKPFTVEEAKVSWTVYPHTSGGVFYLNRERLSFLCNTGKGPHYNLINQGAAVGDTVRYVYFRGEIIEVLER